MIPLFSELPKSLMYWAEFADNPSPTTVQVVAMFGFMLVDDRYEQAIYQHAITLMKKMVAGELDARYADFVYDGNMASVKTFWANPTNRDEFISIDFDGDMTFSLTPDND